MTESLPKRYPDRDEIAAVRTEAEPLESGAEAEATRRLAGRRCVSLRPFAPS